MKFQKITLLAISLLAFEKTRAAVFCGKLSKTKCPDGYCCSALGTCGKSDFHCGIGCQSKYGKCKTSEPENVCGPKHGNKTCPGSQCCGKDGTCGFDLDHCGRGCQSEFGYYCLPPGYENPICIQCMGCSNCIDNPRMSLLCPHACNQTFDYKKDRTVTTTTKKTVVVTTTTTKTPEITEKPILEPVNVCGPKHGNKKCPGNECCNANGECAFDKAHCSISKGCQPKFGYCLPPDAENTMCIACFGCVDCGDDLVVRLNCPSVCRDNLLKPVEPSKTIKPILEPVETDDEDSLINLKPIKTIIPIKTKSLILDPIQTGTQDDLINLKPKNTCGGKTKFSCPGNECCNSKGECGFDLSHCGKGCQSEFGYCLPPGYEKAACIQCVGCMDCTNNPYMALVCGGACKKYEVM